MGRYSNCHAHKKLQEYELSQGHKKKYNSQELQA